MFLQDERIRLVEFMNSVLAENGRLELGIVSIAGPGNPRYAAVDTWGRNEAGELQTWTVVVDCLACRAPIAEGMIVDFATMGPAIDNDGVMRVYGAAAGPSALRPEILAVWKSEFDRLSSLEAWELVAAERPVAANPSLWQRLKSRLVNAFHLFPDGR